MEPCLSPRRLLLGVRHEPKHDPRMSAAAKPDPQHPSVAESDPARVILDNRLIRLGYRISYLANFYTGPLYRRLEAEHGLTRPEFITMFCLAHCPGLTAQDISRMTGRPKNSLSRAVNRLLARGLLTRRPSPADPRHALLELAPDGRALFDALMPLFREREAAMLAPLDAADLAQLEALLEKLVHRTDGWAAPY